MGTNICSNPRTPIADVVFATHTASVSYTDIVVSFTIDISTAVQTVTVPSVVSQTQTETVFYPTVVKTATTTVLTNSPSATSLAPQRRDEKRYRCRPKTSGTLSSALALFPIASNCPSLEDYSSACACITAVSTTLSVTLPAETSTSTTDTTVSVAISSTSLSSVTSVVTSTAYVTTPTTVTQTVTTPTTTTSSATATVTLVPGGPCVANPACAPAGFNIDYYKNVAGGYAGVWGNGVLPPSYYITQGLKPLDSSLTNLTYYPANDRPTGRTVVYPYTDRNEPYYVGWTRSTNGGVTVDANNYTLVYEGLFRAPKTGPYIFCTSADDESDLFFGHGNALSCLDGTAPANATPFLTTKNAAGLGLPICKSVALTEGLYYPFRNVAGNGMGPGAFRFTVQLPSSVSITNDFSGYAHPRQCGFFT